MGEKLVSHNVFGRQQSLKSRRKATFPRNCTAIKVEEIMKTTVVVMILKVKETVERIAAEVK